MPAPGGLRRVLVDLSPLRLDRDYRRMWSGQVVSGIGNQITRVALPFQIYTLTGSPLAIGILAAVQLVPILLFSLGGGAIADAMDRRRLLLFTTSGLAVTSAILVALALNPAPPVLALYAVAFIAAALVALDQPARASSTPRLVPPQRLPAAIALSQLNFQIASVIGPAIGGIVIAAAGLSAAYAIDAVSFGAVLVAVAGIAPLPPLGQAVRPGIAAIREGLSFAWRRRVIASTFAIDLDAMLFGMPTSLFPVLALTVYHGGPTEVGLLNAAPAAGALVGAAMSGWVSGIRRPGRATIIAVLGWGLAITAFGLVPFSFALALLFLAIAGGADVLSAVFRSTIVQFETPDSLRGRVTAIHMLVVTSGPRMGDLEAAVVATLVGAQASIVSGGLLCLAGVAAVARLFPELASYVSRVGAGAMAAGPGTGTPAPADDEAVAV